MKKPLICSQCGAPLHSNKCEYCGTEYETDFIKVRYVNYTQPVDTLKAIIEVPQEIIYRQDQKNFINGYIKPQLAKQFGEKICDYMDVETWFDSGKLTQIFGATVKVGIPREGI